jgi:hypothetical protein
VNFFIWFLFTKMRQDLCSEQRNLKNLLNYSYEKSII